MSKKDSEKDRIEEEVLRTLESLDTIKDIDAGPYFYTRLQARLESSEKVPESWLTRHLLGSRLAPALLATVVVINVFTAVMVLQDGSDGQAELRDEYVEAVADEYLLTGASNTLDSDSE